MKYALTLILALVAASATAALIYASTALPCDCCGHVPCTDQWFLCHLFIGR